MTCTYGKLRPSNVTLWHPELCKGGYVSLSWMSLISKAFAPDRLFGRHSGLRSQIFPLHGITTDSA